MRNFRIYFVPCRFADDSNPTVKTINNIVVKQRFLIYFWYKYIDQYRMEWNDKNSV